MENYPRLSPSKADLHFRNLRDAIADNEFARIRDAHSEGEILRWGMVEGLHKKARAALWNQNDKRPVHLLPHLLMEYEHNAAALNHGVSDANVRLPAGEASRLAVIAENALAYSARREIRSRIKAYNRDLLKPCASTSLSLPDTAVGMLEYVESFAEHVIASARLDGGDHAGRATGADKMTIYEDVCDDIDDAAAVSSGVFSRILTSPVSSLSDDELDRLASEFGGRPTTFYEFEKSRCASLLMMKIVEAISRQLNVDLEKDGCENDLSR